jgi:hypothetical protein
MFFSYYIYSRQNALFVYFVVSLIINILVAVVSTKKKARLVSMLFAVIICNYFACTVYVLLGNNLFSYEYYFDLIELIFFYQAAMMTTGSWLIPIIAYAVLRLFQNRRATKENSPLPNNKQRDSYGD